MFCFSQDHSTSLERAHITIRSPPFFTLLAVFFLQYLPIMAESIVLAGGTSLIPGVPERLHAELCHGEYLPRGVAVRVIAAPERDRAAVVGAAVLARDADFVSSLCVSRQTYLTQGPEAALKYCDVAAGVCSWRGGNDDSSGSDGETETGAALIGGEKLPAIVQRLCRAPSQNKEELGGVDLGALAASVDALQKHADSLFHCDTSRASDQRIVELETQLDRLKSRWEAADKIRCPSSEKSCNARFARVEARAVAAEAQVAAFRQKEAD